MDYKDQYYYEVKTLGMPGDLYQSYTVTQANSPFVPTGSDFGYGSVVIVDGTGVTFDMAISGSVSGVDLDYGRIYPFAFRKVTVASGSTGKVYVFKGLRK